jgi:hypothetical protein
MHPPARAPFQEKGPDLGLRQEDERGIEGRQGTLDGAGEIERKRHARIGRRHRRRNRETGGRRSGNHPGNSGRLLPDRLEDRAGGVHLAYGNTMNPDTSVEMREGRQPEPGAPVPDFLPTQAFPREGVGRIGDEPCRQNEPVKHHCERLYAPATPRHVDHSPET